MPRRLLKKIVPAPAALRDRWPVRICGERMADPQLWTLHRRAVTYAFAAGLAISFVPLPVHLLLAVVVALLWRINLPVIYGTTWLLANPFTLVPLYYLAYRVGVAILGVPPHRFRFVADWRWLRYGLAPVWQPFMVGCLVCAVVTALLGWLALELVWRWHVASRYRARHTLPSAPAG
jgi:uncharacterized protein